MNGENTTPSERNPVRHSTSAPTSCRVIADWWSCIAACPQPSVSIGRSHLTTSRDAFHPQATLRDISASLRVSLPRPSLLFIATASLLRDVVALPVDPASPLRCPLRPLPLPLRPQPPRPRSERRPTSSAASSAALSSSNSTPASHTKVHHSAAPAPAAPDTPRLSAPLRSLSSLTPPCSSCWPLSPCRGAGLPRWLHERGHGADGGVRRRTAQSQLSYPASAAAIDALPTPPLRLCTSPLIAFPSSLPLCDGTALNPLPSLQAKYGDSFIRGNNILYISAQRRKPKP